MCAMFSQHAVVQAHNVVYALRACACAWCADAQDCCRRYPHQRGPNNRRNCETGRATAPGSFAPINSDRMTNLVSLSVLLSATRPAATAHLGASGRCGGGPRGAADAQLQGDRPAAAGDQVVSQRDAAGAVRASRCAARGLAVFPAVSGSVWAFVQPTN